jgi:hypothetical protein
MRTFQNLITTALFLLLPLQLQAQAQGNSQNLDELKKRLEELERTTREQIEALRQQIKEQEATITSLQEQAAPTTAAMPSPPKPPTAPTRPQHETSAAAQEETFSRDQESAARINNAPLDPKLQGFFPIPGTPARVKFDGYAKLDINIDPRPAGNVDQFNTSTIPVGVPENAKSANVNLHARQTRFTVDFRSPTPFGEDLRVYFEGDFYGPNGGTDPRLRHYFGQLKNLLVGQTWTTFTDADTIPDTLDFQGPAGIVVTRQVQIRYTQPLTKRNSLAFSAERPSVQSRALITGGRTITPYPDGVVRWRYEGSRGHVQMGTLYRGIGYNTGTVDRTVFGWGLNASGGIKVVGRDLLELYGSYGHGMARYVQNLDGLGLDLDLNNEGTNLKALPVVAAYGDYKHYWVDHLRSTITTGFVRVQNTVPQPATTFSKSYYMSGNLIWNPIGSLNVGLEFLHGWQVLKDDSQGSANRVQLSLRYDLYRKVE